MPGTSELVWSKWADSGSSVVSQPSFWFREESYLERTETRNIFLWPGQRHVQCAFTLKYTHTKLDCDEIALFNYTFSHIG